MQSSPFQPPQARLNIQAKHDALVLGEHSINPKLIPAAPLKVTKKLIKAGYEAYLVGGCIRDILLGLTPKDFDIATSATPNQIKRLFGHAGRIIGRRFRIVHVYQDNDCVEVATFRAAMDETVAKAYKVGRRLNSRTSRKHNNRYGDLSDDAQRRDFTINALYYNPVDNRLYDFAKGSKDIACKKLRLLGDADIRYREDPVRMLRAARFQARFGFKLDRKSEAPIKELAPMLSLVPAARLCGEVVKLFLTGHAAASLNSLASQGLLSYLFPDLAKVTNDADWQLLKQSLQLIDRRINASEQVSTRFLYMLLLWPSLQARLRKEAMGDARFNEQYFTAHIATLMSRPDAMISTTARLRVTLHELFLMQHQLSLHKPSTIQFSRAVLPLIAQIAEFMSLCGKFQSERSLAEQGATWQHYAEQNFSKSKKPQRHSRFSKSGGGPKQHKPNRHKNRTRNNKDTTRWQKTYKQS